MGRKSSGLNYQGAGGFWRTDDKSGFTVRAYNTRKEWTQAQTDEKFWEPRQPQDFVRGVKDDQTVPDPRPEPPNIFGGPIYVALTANVAVGATFIPLGNISGLSAGDKIGVMTNLEQWFRTTISGAPISTGINITNPMPLKASSGNMMVRY